MTTTHSELGDMAEAAMYLATVAAIRRAAETGTPVIVWRDGEMKAIPSDEIELPPPSARALEAMRKARERA